MHFILHNNSNTLCNLKQQKSIIDTDRQSNIFWTFEVNPCSSIHLLLEIPVAFQPYHYWSQLTCVAAAIVRTSLMYIIFMQWIVRYAIHWCNSFLILSQLVDVDWTTKQNQCCPPICQTLNLWIEFNPRPSLNPLLEIAVVCDPGHDWSELTCVAAVNIRSSLINIIIYAMTYHLCFPLMHRTQHPNSIRWNCLSNETKPRHTTNPTYFEWLNSIHDHHCIVYSNAGKCNRRAARDLFP